MAKKSNTVKEEQAKIKAKLEEAIKRNAEIEELLKQAEEEEKKKMEDAEKQIQEIASSGGMFCGVILTRQGIFAILNLAMDTKENIRIPFKLYYNE